MSTLLNLNHKLSEAVLAEPLISPLISLPRSPLSNLLIFLPLLDLHLSDPHPLFFLLLLIQLLNVHLSLNDVLNLFQILVTMIERVPSC